MKLKVKNAINTDGTLGVEISIHKPGYKKSELPEAYLKGQCFWVEEKVLWVQSEFNPLTHEHFGELKTHCVDFSTVWTHEEFNYFMVFLTACGQRLVDIKEIIDSGVLDDDPYIMEV